MKQRPFSPWSEVRQSPRPRLLVEDPSPAVELAEFRFFEASGFDVALCSGPCEGQPCPLTKGEECRLVDQADVVLMGPGMAGYRAEVASAIHDRRPDLPVVVQVPRADPDQCPPDCIPNYYPVSVDGQIRSLWRALEQRPARLHPAAAEAAGDTPPPSTARTSTIARLVDLLGW